MLGKEKIESKVKQLFGSDGGRICDRGEFCLNEEPVKLLGRRAVGL